METLLKSEFAARLRVSKARVSQMIQMGLPLTADGKVEVSAALNWIETHIDLSHKDSAARRSDAAARRQSDAVPSPSAPAAGLPDPGRILLTAKAKRALVDLRRAERMERLENDELIEAVEVRRAIDGLIANAKAKLIGLGHRVGPRVAIETDASRCQQMIDDVVSEALLDLTGYQL
jgi:hypothetical protein